MKRIDISDVKSSAVSMSDFRQCLLVPEGPVRSHSKSVQHSLIGVVEFQLSIHSGGRGKGRERYLLIW